MTGKLSREIRQTRPFRSVEEEALLNLMRTSDHLMREVEGVLKAPGLSPTQYNVLRILRGAGSAGLACRQIGERMVTRDPDITRLLDRLEKRGLIRRAREQEDRRVITTRISAEGLRVVKEMDRPIAELHQRIGRRLGQRKMRVLIETLEQLRSRRAGGGAGSDEL